MNPSNTFVFPIIRQDFILNCLRSLAANVADNEHQIVVVNQTRYTNTTFQKSLREWADVVVTPKVNYGFAQAANLGTRLATTKYVTICNDDVLFFWKDWWAGILETFKRFPEALGVAPMSPKEPGWGYGEEGYRLHLSEQVLKCVPHEHPFWHRALRLYATQTERLVQRQIRIRKGAVVDGIAMWCTTLRRKPWVRLGMFDERFFPGGGEDYDACSRAYKAGFRILSSSYSWVWHHWGYSKDHPTGFDSSLPRARGNWNYLSTESHETEGLWNPDLDVWGRSGERTDKVVRRESL